MNLHLQDKSMEELPPRRRRSKKSPQSRPSGSSGSRPPAQRPRRRRRRSGPSFELTYHRVLGIFGICFGGMVMLSSFCGGGWRVGGSYGAGVCCAGFMGLLFFISGIYYTIRG
ncbi:MAG: hypothetical protein R3C11_08550 [Planctomycetaceae bacterium]